MTESGGGIGQIIVGSNWLRLYEIEPATLDQLLRPGMSKVIPLLLTHADSTDAYWPVVLDGVSAPRPVNLLEGVTGAEVLDGRQPRR
jgi:hypothetical protein